jgi:transcriptional regulator with XRE-family HTH domain
MRRYSKLGSFLKKKRIQRGLTQKQVSDSFGFTTSQFISNLELAKSPPPPGVMKRLVKLYQLRLDEVLKVLLKEEDRFWRDQLK